MKSKHTAKRGSGKTASATVAPPPRKVNVTFDFKNAEGNRHAFLASVPETWLSGGAWKS